MLDAERISSLRTLFPVTRRYVFLNHAAVAPVSTRVVVAMNEYLTSVLEAGGLHEDRWLRRVEEARRHAARLIGASPEEVAFLKNTTEGLLTVANGIRWQEGDNVIVPSCEFPANIYPWRNLERRLGVEVRFVKPRGVRLLPEDFFALVDRRTRAIAVSFVEYASGFRNDLDTLGAFCRERGIFLVVDAIQGLGALPLDVSRTPVDFLSADGHKWLLGPEGISLFYCRRERLEDLEPLEAGWMSVVNAEEYAPDYSIYTAPLREDALRFEPGTRNNVGIFGLGEAIELILEVGVENIAERLMLLTDHLVEGLRHKGYRILSSLEPKERSGIISFDSPRHDMADLRRRLRDAGIIVALRHNALRVSPHFYNTLEEIDALLETLPEG